MKRLSLVVRRVAQSPARQHAELMIALAERDDQAISEEKA